MKLSIKLNNLAFYIYLITFCWGQELSFKDMTEQGALDFIHDHGGSGEYYYIEAMGSGICIFDYDETLILGETPKGETLSAFYRRNTFLNNLFYKKTNLVKLAKEEKANKTTVLIGPEGDFSVSEIEMALQNQFKAVNLGTSRLRTETAGLVTVHTINLKY